VHFAGQRKAINVISGWWLDPAIAGLAVVYLAEDAHVLPAAINTKDSALKPDRDVRLVGLGRKSATDSDSGGKKRAAWLKVGVLNPERNSEYVFTVTGSSSKTVCPGDTGAPVLVFDGGRATVLGVVYDAGTTTCTKASDGIKVQRVDLSAAVIESKVRSQPPWLDATQANPTPTLPNCMTAGDRGFCLGQDIVNCDDEGSVKCPPTKACEDVRSLDGRLESTSGCREAESCTSGLSGKCNGNVLEVCTDGRLRRYNCGHWGLFCAKATDGAWCERWQANCRRSDKTDCLDTKNADCRGTSPVGECTPDGKLSFCDFSTGNARNLTKACGKCGWNPTLLRYDCLE